MSRRSTKTKQRESARQQACVANGGHNYVEVSKAPVQLRCKGCDKAKQQ